MWMQAMVSILIEMIVRAVRERARTRKEKHSA